MRYALFLLVSVNSMSLSAQSIAINKIKLAKKIDSLFQSYNNKILPVLLSPFYRMVKFSPGNHMAWQTPKTKCHSHTNL